jgi:uncharacterized damage-inducible protein DinB
MAKADKALKTELVKQLKGGNAHAKFEEAVASLPSELRGKKVDHLPYSIWQLLEHMRIAQRDMLDFCRNHDGRYKEMKWPDDYWPKSSEPARAKAWDESIRQFHSDRDEFVALIENDNADLFTPFAWGEGQTLLHEAMLIVDHNGYHLGEIIALRRLLSAWK